MRQEFDRHRSPRRPGEEGGVREGSAASYDSRWRNAGRRRPMGGIEAGRSGQIRRQGGLRFGASTSRGVVRLVVDGITLCASSSTNSSGVIGNDIKRLLEADGRPRCGVGCTNNPNCSECERRQDERRLAFAAQLLLGHTLTLPGSAVAKVCCWGSQRILSLAEALKGPTGTLAPAFKSRRILI